MLRPQDISVHATLVQVNASIYPSEVGFLVLGIWTLCHEIPAPSTSSEDQSAIMNVLVWAHRGREWRQSQATHPSVQPPSSTMGPLSRRHNRGLQRKGRRKACRVPSHRRGHSSPGKCQYLGTAISISANPPTCDSCSRLWWAALRSLEFPIPRPGPEPRRHHLGWRHTGCREQQQWTSQLIKQLTKGSRVFQNTLQIAG